MDILESLEENFRFMAMEVEHQVKLTFALLNDGNPDLLVKIAARDDYVDNLKTIIENTCFSELFCAGGEPGDDINTVRAIHAISVNLERIGDFCVNIARQTEYLLEFSILHQAGYREMFSVVQTQLSRLMPALRSRDLSLALEICRAERRLDELYKENFDWIMARMRKGHFIEDLITTLFIFRYIERIGDALLNIGEALVFSVMGERIKIDQLEAMQDTLTHSRLASNLEDVGFTSILGSRSGCRISRIDTEEGGSPVQGIFKEGNKDKIRREKENIDRWESLYPGLAPKVYGYREGREKASMLVEFLPGQTLEAAILHADEAVLAEAVPLLGEVLHTIWERTCRPETLSTDYMGQLRDRLDTVLRVHPGFAQPKKSVNGIAVSSTDDLIRACMDVERRHPAPVRTLIHGDFNVNNIVYHAPTRTIRFIDLYRSQETDYVQDVSVFLVSNFRLPMFDASVRRRLNRVTGQIYDFAAQFARRIEDRHFEWRMGLALSRSFFTSTRFELNGGFAREMMQRARYLMEKLVQATPESGTFHLPREILFY